MKDFKEFINLDEASSAAIRMQKALEKIKTDRERKERLAAPYVPVKSVFNQEKPVKESNEHYEEAEEHLSKANDAEAKGDMKSFHAHMADHHDAMSEWHDSKGRSASADKHADKAEYHHEKSLTVKEEAVVEATGDKSFDSMMSRIKKGTKKQATVDRREKSKQSQERARNAFGPSPADALSLKKESVLEDIEQIDEISQDTKDSYMKKSTQQVKELKPHLKGEYADIAKRMLVRRKKGLALASK